ncbi:MAG: hypothetical protein Kow00122_17680 [Thermoleophilia bacterium]
MSGRIPPRLVALFAAALLLALVAGAALRCTRATAPEADVTAEALAGLPTRQLLVSAATDSSHLPGVGTTTYDAANLIDGALSTAWIVGAGTDPEGETATLRLAGPALLEKVEIANGYQKSASTARRNGRAVFLLLTFSDGTSSSVSLEDRGGWQLADIADVVTTSVTVKFIKIYPGTDRALASAALSEIRLLGKARDATTTSAPAP